MATALEDLDELVRFGLVVDDDSFTVWVSAVDDWRAAPTSATRSLPVLHLDGSCREMPHTREQIPVAALRTLLADGMPVCGCHQHKYQLLNRVTDEHLITDDTKDWCRWVCAAETALAGVEYNPVGRLRRLLVTAPDTPAGDLCDARTRELVGLLRAAEGRALAAPERVTDLLETLVIDASTVRGRLAAAGRPVRAYAPEYLRSLGEQLTLSARATELLDRHQMTFGFGEVKASPLTAAEEAELVAELTRATVWLVLLEPCSNSLQVERLLGLAEDYSVERPDVLRLPLVALLASSTDAGRRFAFADAGYPRAAVETATELAAEPADIATLAAAIVAAAA